MSVLNKPVIEEVKEVLESVEEESESMDFPKNYKMRVRNSEKGPSTQSKIFKMSLNSKKQNSDSFNNQQKQNLNKFCKSQTVNFDEKKNVVEKEMNLQWAKICNNMTRVKIVQQEESDSDEENKISIKFKSLKMSRSRKGSEDIAIGMGGSSQLWKISTTMMESKVPQIKMIKEDSEMSF